MFQNKKSQEQIRHENKVREIRTILRLKESDEEKKNMLLGIMDRESREAFVMGKASAYREMFEVVKMLAEKRGSMGDVEKEVCKNAENPG